MLAIVMRFRGVAEVGGERLRRERVRRDALPADDGAVAVAVVAVVAAPVGAGGAAIVGGQRDTLGRDGEAVEWVVRVGLDEIEAHRCDLDAQTTRKISRLPVVHDPR